jgi:hypothetical protein
VTQRETPISRPPATEDEPSCEASGPELARLVRHALNRGNVLEGPLKDRIADGGNPGCQGQVSTHCGHSHATPLSKPWVRVTRTLAPRRERGGVQAARKRARTPFIEMGRSPGTNSANHG